MASGAGECGCGQAAACICSQPAGSLKRPFNQLDGNVALPSLRALEEAVLLRERGNVALQAQRLEEARNLFSQALLLDPESHLLLCSRSQALLELGDLNAAEADARRCAALRPDFSKAHYRLGLALERQGRLEPARAALAACIAIEAEPEAPLLAAIERVSLKLGGGTAANVGGNVLAPTWYCASCTFENDDGLTACEMCDSKRPRALTLPPAAAAFAAAAKAPSLSSALAASAEVAHPAIASPLSNPFAAAVAYRPAPPAPAPSVRVLAAAPAAPPAPAAEHCSHCKGGAAPCACPVGCARVAASLCTNERNGHCVHCLGNAGICACGLGCVRGPSAKCVSAEAEHFDGDGAVEGSEAANAALLRARHVGVVARVFAKPTPHGLM